MRRVPSAAGTTSNAKIPLLRRKAIHVVAPGVAGAVLVFIALTLVGCGSSTGEVRSTHELIKGVLVADGFDDLSLSANHWVADFSPTTAVQIGTERENGNVFMFLKSTSDSGSEERAVYRTFDLTAARGHRIRLSVRVRTPGTASAVSVKLSVLAPGRPAVYSDSAETQPASSDTWSTKYAVLDVDSAATTGRISLVAHGGGTAWFDDVSVVSLGLTPVAQRVRLSPDVRDRIATTARVLGLVRYFHPSDQSARLDWDAFSVHAIDTVLRTSTSVSMHALLRRLFAPITIGVQFEAKDRPTASTLPRDAKATHLARWYRVGLGSGDADTVYYGFRDGIIAEDQASTYVHTDVALPHPGTCRTAEIRTTIHSTSGTVWLLAMLFQSGQRSKYIREQIVAQKNSLLTVRGEVAADTQDVQVGFFMSGQASIDVGSVSFTCADGQTKTLEPDTAWAFTSVPELFSKSVSHCDKTTCLSVRRGAYDAEFRSERDTAAVDIGSGLQMVMPLAVWTDGKITYPHQPEVELPPPEYTLPDLSVRLASVATIWNTLSSFYPYFRDHNIDWESALSNALSEVAAAGSAEQTHHVLSQLVARLRDGHARVRHPTQLMSGMLPMELRQLGKKIFVVGGLSEYLEAIPPGSELISLDGVAASEIYESKRSVISAATPQALDYLSSLYISLGPIGKLRLVRVRTPIGVEVQRLLPLVSREQYDKRIHGRRPSQGSELSPGIYYVSVADLEPAMLPKLIQSLSSARVVIFDARGYVPNAAFELLSHFVARPIHSPDFRIPVASIHFPTKYQDASWIFRPAVPHVDSRLIVIADARVVSMGETFLELIRDNKLATFVGEPSAGTNGNVTTFAAPGGFEVRFTGMHVTAPDGSTIQGHGIVPDITVHPTLEGIQSGRDEVLEAALALAQPRTP